MGRNLVFLFLIILSSAYGRFPDIPEPSIHTFQTRSDGEYRLPPNTVPISYDIELEPFFDSFTFDGRISIQIQVVQDTESIVMHSSKLYNFGGVLVEGLTGSPIDISPTFDTTDLQLITFPLPQMAVAGTTLTLSMTYSGVLNDNNEGFYRASYEEDGLTKWFATTQFQSVFAREAFPCYDEPALRATFKITLIRPENYHSISNAELSQTIERQPGRFYDEFEETVAMSTYLVAFVVSELAFTDRRENQMVFATRDLIADGRGEYALDVGIDMLRVMEEFTDVEYKMDKIFQVAIPDDWFAAGAMENWGLVTYRERFLLYKEGLTTSSEKQFIALIIAHEYGHQWFGNLVSPMWWRYLWINEGFATYFEYVATDQVEPEMRMMDQYVTYACQFAMATDSLETTRPMSIDVQSPSEIESLFDRVAYEKSGSVIRMMEHMLTTDIFKRGLNIFLTTLEFNSAEGKDLWDSMQAAVEQLDTGLLQGRTVQQIMETWELQAGFPVIFVSRGDGQVTINQTRFLLHRHTHNYDTTWTIPINYATASDPNFTDTKATYWLTETTQNFDIPVNDAEWIIVNKQETGYYRVNYDNENWQLIIDYLNSDDYNQIHVLNRAQLVDDAINLARSGRLDYDITMNLLLCLKRETDYIPLYSFFTGLTHLHRFIINTEQYDLFKEYVKEILQAAYEELGTEDTGLHTEKLNRINVLTWLCRYGHEECVDAMHVQLNGLAPAAPDLQTAVYCSGQRDTTNGNAKLEFLLNRYFGNDAEELEKGRILNALGCSTSEEVLTRVLNIALGKEAAYPFVDSVQVNSIFASVYTQSDVGLRVAFNYIINNFEELDETLSQSRVSSILTGIADRITSQEQMQQWAIFVRDLPQETQTRYMLAISSATLVMTNNAAWSALHIEDISAFITTYSNGYVFAISIPVLIITTLSHIFV